MNCSGDVSTQSESRTSATSPRPARATTVSASVIAEWLAGQAGGN